jgi:hypothetical protein
MRMFEKILAELSNMKFHEIVTPSEVLVLLHADRREHWKTDRGAVLKQKWEAERPGMEFQVGEAHESWSLSVW